MVASARAAALFCIAILLNAFSAAARTPTPEDILGLRDLGDYRGGLSISPDGAFIAVIERQADLSADRYNNRLLLLPSSGGEPLTLAGVGDVILRPTPYGFTGAFADRAPVWSPSGDHLAFLVMRDGRVELWCVAASGTAPEQVAGGDADVLRFAWLDDRRLLVEAAAARATLETAALRAERFGFHPTPDHTPYANIRPPRWPGSGATQLVIDLATEESRAASTEQRERLNARPRAPVGEGAIATDETSGALAWIAPRVPGDPATTPPLGLYRANADGTDLRRCELPECTGRMLGVWTIGSEIVFRRMEGHGDGLTALYGWDWSRNVVRLIRRADEELFGCGRADGRLVCLQESPLQPRRLVSIDPAGGQLRALYDPNPQWRDLQLTRIETIEVEDAYGNESFAHLVFPRNYIRGRRYPVVIVQYRSRGFLRGGVGGEYPIHALAGAGYFVLSVDRPEWRGAEAQLPYRELSQRTELDGSENRMKQSALEAMLDELDRRGLSDPSRVGITGLSDGAETVYWAITHSNLFAAAVASTPPTDPTAWTLGAESFRRIMRDEGMQGPWAEPSSPWAEWWSTNSIVLHADAIRTPLLMNLPESEAMMGFPLHTRLAELDRPVELYVYPDAYHIKWRPRQLLSAQRRSLDWLDFWLRGTEREDPDEPERLERWRALRALASDGE